MHYLIKIEPRPQGLPRFTRSGHTYKDPKDTKWRAEFLALMPKPKDLLLGALKLEVEFRFKKPKTVKRDLHTVRPDLDNCCKAVLDALNNVLWNDDAQIIEIVARKVYHETPSIYFEVTEV